MLAARLQVRKIFVYQAWTPVVYNAGIVGGAWLLHAKFHVFSLGIGVLVGMLVGSAGLNAWGALRTGLRFRPAVDFHAPVFLEWVRLSLPLMIIPREN